MATKHNCFAVQTVLENSPTFTELKEENRFCDSLKSSPRNAQLIWWPTDTNDRMLMTRRCRKTCMEHWSPSASDLRGGRAGQLYEAAAARCLCTREQRKRLSPRRTMRMETTAQMALMSGGGRCANGHPHSFCTRRCTPLWSRCEFGRR